MFLLYSYICYFVFLLIRSVKFCFMGDEFCNLKKDIIVIKLMYLIFYNCKNKEINNFF